MTKTQQDQAAGLRSLTDPGDKMDSQIRVIAVTSGKGGVGKTSVVANMAISMARLGKKVLVMDADMSLHNLDIMLGISPQYNISHVFSGEKRLEEILVEGPAGIKILPASEGAQELSLLNDIQKLTLLDQMDSLEDQVDVFLIDTAAGIGNTVLYFNQAAQDRVVVVTPELTSITDAYTLIKVLAIDRHEKYFRLLINEVQNEKEAMAVYKKLVDVADEFLSDVSLDYLGFVPHDRAILKAVRLQRAVVEAFPESAASKNFVKLSRRLLDDPGKGSLEGNMRFFFKRFLTMPVVGLG